MMKILLSVVLTTNALINHKPNSHLNHDGGQLCSDPVTCPATDTGTSAALPPLYNHPEKGSGQCTNWDSMQKCKPSRIEYPSSTEEVQHIIQSANKAGQKVKMFGSGHSYSAIAKCDDGTVSMSLTNMNRTISINNHTKPYNITVQGGARLYQMYHIMEQHNIAFQAVGNIMAQHIAGALSTATHGTDGNVGSFSSVLLSAKIVVANGTELFIDTTHRYMDAVRTSYGALGVITEVTLQAVPTYQMRMGPHYVQGQTRGEHYAEFDGDLRPLSALKEIRTMNINDSNFYNSQYTVGLTLGNSSMTGYHQIPNGTVSLNFWQRCDQKRISTTPNSCAPWSVAFVEAVEPAHLTYEAEFAVEENNTHDVLSEFTDHVKNQTISKHLDWTIVLRYVSAESGWLAPAYKRNSTFLTLYTQCVNYTLPSNSKAYDIPCNNPIIHDSFLLLYNGLWDIASRFNARPHPGKENDVNASYMAKVYPKFKDFNMVRKQWDPNGMFMNSYLQQRLVESN